MTKRTLTIIGLVCISVLLLGFRGAGYRADRTLYGDYVFNGSVDIVDASLWIKGDSLFLTDGGEDTNWVVNDGNFSSPDTGDPAKIFRHPA